MDAGQVMMPVCESLCFFCPALRARSRHPIKRYKKLLSDIFPRSQVLYLFSLLSKIFWSFVNGYAFFGQEYVLISYSFQSSSDQVVVLYRFSSLCFLKFVPWTGGWDRICYGVELEILQEAKFYILSLFICISFQAKMDVITEETSTFSGRIVSIFQPLLLKV